MRHNEIVLMAAMMLSGAGAIARARPRAALVEACALREASERGQKRVRRLHGILRTGSRGPAKG